MPLGDKTGPVGKGPRTGRGLGGCPIIEKILEKKRTNVPAKGSGKGSGRGSGRRKGANGITYYT